MAVASRFAQGKQGGRDDETLGADKASQIRRKQLAVVAQDSLSNPAAFPGAALDLSHLAVDKGRWAAMRRRFASA
jgi:hypothetical protein